MKTYGLIGYPLSHSFSKKYFTEKFLKEGITDARYELFPLAQISELSQLLTSRPDLCGLNVTIPYKEQLHSFLHEENDVVAATGACNCIRIKDGKLKGFNTDVIVFEKSLLGLWKPSQKKALVLGTGGASKAVLFVLKKLGIESQLVSRNPSVGSIGYKDVTKEIIKDHLLIINTTPAGMYPHADECPPLPYDAIGAQHFLFDLIYNPDKTLFLKKGEERGAAIQNGYDMLIIQAEESWKIWNQ